MKRLIYGIPIMKAYRDYRMRRHADHLAGFLFADATLFFDSVRAPEEREIIEKQIEVLAMAVDIGANQGLYTCLAAARGK